MNWEDVLKRKDILDGDLEAQESGHIYRGPIKAIELNNGTVTITLEWCATKPAPGNPVSGEWKPSTAVVATINSNIHPQEISDNRLTVSVAGFGTWIIYPKGGSKLDPVQVVGLKVG